MDLHVKSVQLNTLLTPPLCHNCALPGRIRSRCRFNTSSFASSFAHQSQNQNNITRDSNAITTCSMCLRHGKQSSNCCSTENLS
jgi:hypothetical protein